jgi:hypothetical protein
VRRDDPDLLAFLIDKPHLANTNPLVDASLNWSGNNLPPGKVLRLVDTINNGDVMTATALSATQQS